MLCLSCGSTSTLPPADLALIEPTPACSRGKLACRALRFSFPRHPMPLESRGLAVSDLAIAHRVGLQAPGRVAPVQGGARGRRVAGGGADGDDDLGRGGCLCSLGVRCVGAGHGPSRRSEAPIRFSTVAQRHMLRMQPAGSGPVWLLAAQRDAYGSPDPEGLHWYRSDDGLNWSYYREIFEDGVEDFELPPHERCRRARKRHRGGVLVRHDRDGLALGFE